MSIDLIPSDGNEFSFLILGTAVGVCYGFDGWTASQKDTELNKTARLKNLKYAVSGVILTLIADFNSIHITTPKQSLLQYYIEGFAVAAITVVAAVTLCLYFKYRRILHSDLKEFIPASFSPVLDYLLYGFNFYRSNSEKTLKEAEDDKNDSRNKRYAAFLPEYMGQVSNAIAAVDYYLGIRSEEARKRVAREVLECIRVVVVASLENQEGVVINTNYMVAYKASALPAGLNLKERLQYALKGPDGYDCFLSLEEYAKPEGREHFILPVESKTAGWESRILPGAPLAFLEQQTDVIDDTESMHFDKDFDKGLADEITRYFKSKAFKSFASINIISGGESRGIVNVESNRKNVFGTTGKKKKETEVLLKPFCQLLAFVINP